MERLSFKVKKSGKVSKIALEEIKGLSFSALNKAFRKKDVKINGKRIGKDETVNIGDTVEIFTVIKEIENYTEIYRDDNVLIVNKSDGVSSEDLFKKLSEKESEIYFIHRLDTNTSGLMVFALNKASEKELLSGFKNRTFIKLYKAEVIGFFDKKEDVLTAYLVKDSESGTVKIYSKKVDNSVEIKTGYKVIKENEKTSELSVRLYTGKTHQIRAHFAHIGHPVVGDGKYGDNAFNKSVGAKKQRLISYSITFNFNKESILNYLDKKTFTVE